MATIAYHQFYCYIYIAGHFSMSGNLWNLSWGRKNPNTAGIQDWDTSEMD